MAPMLLITPTRVLACHGKQTLRVVLILPMLSFLILMMNQFDHRPTPPIALLLQIGHAYCLFTLECYQLGWSGDRNSRT